MQEFTIQCGCGRSMAPEYRKGPGAFRCGCGARIQASLKAAAPKRQCWFADCNDGVTTEPPLDLCADHEREAALLLAHLVAERQLWLEAGQQWKPLANYGRPQPTEHSEYGSKVYFMRRESLIKIGYSSNIARRAGEICAVVLATTPGGPSAEAAMHRRFASLRRMGEWFEPGPELVDFINELRAASKDRPIHA